MLQLIDISIKKNIKLIIENPSHSNYLIKHALIKSPDLVITNRRLLGDYFNKPTAFWFYNVEPTTFNIIIFEQDVKFKTVVNSNGIDRSLMSNTFATNFINKYIFGF